MRFIILKSSFDGISGGAATYTDIEEILREIRFHKGWDSLKELHDSIRKWFAVCRPGDVFCTQVTAIVATSINPLDYEVDICPHCDYEGLDYGDLQPVESGDIEQEVECPNCSERWIDVFTLTEQRSLVKKKKKNE